MPDAPAPISDEPLSYRVIPPPKLKPSPMGVVALACSLLVPGILLTERIQPYLSNAGILSSNVDWQRGWIALCIGSYALFPVGLILGILAVLRDDSKRIAATLACVINACVMTLWLIWLYRSL